MSLLRTLMGGLIGGAARSKGTGKGITGAAIGMAAARLATRSIPGALLVGGGLVAKHFWDKRRRDALSDEEALAGRSPADAASEPEQLGEIEPREID